MASRQKLRQGSEKSEVTRRVILNLRRPCYRWSVPRLRDSRTAGVHGRPIAAHNAFARRTEGPFLGAGAPRSDNMFWGRAGARGNWFNEGTVLRPSVATALPTHVRHVGQFPPHPPDQMPHPKKHSATRILVSKPNRLSCILAAVLIGLSASPSASAANAETTVNIDVNANRHPISPHIYGVNWASAEEIAALNAPINRSGGNANSRYNWELDAHSAGADWFFETYPDSNGTPGGWADTFVATTRAAGNGAEPILTVPMLDYLADLGPGRSTLAGFSVAKYGAQEKVDPWNADAGNGIDAKTGEKITGNDPTDTGVPNSPEFQKRWLQHLVAKYGTAAASSGIKYYSLDNEPSAWVGTHRDVHPEPTTYDEMWQKILAYGTVVRAVDPAAKICAGEEWSWWPMYASGRDMASGTAAATSDYNTHERLHYYPWLLKKIKEHKDQTGVQLVDILTVHAYGDGPGEGDDLATQQQRNRATRILWDPTYEDPNWFGDVFVEGRSGRIVNWLPTLKAWVTQYCPGLKIGITEYNWGNEKNLNGATTQADVLGIYGREGVDLATRWGVGKDDSTYNVTFLATQIYRNYDGKNSTFGDTSVAATVANPDNLSAFASVRTTDGALTVMVINKQQGSTPVKVAVANFNAGTKAQVWRIDSAAQKSITHLADVSLQSNTIATTVPSQSITLFVVPAGTASPAEPPPTTTTGSTSSNTSGGGGGAAGPWFLGSIVVLLACRRSSPAKGHQPTLS